MCYYITTDRLIANVLILKAESKKESVLEVKTDIAEMVRLYDFSFKESEGNCIFELSSKDVLSTIQFYPEFFRYYKNTNNIMFSQCITEDEERTTNSFSLPKEIKTIFVKFFNSSYKEKEIICAG